MEADQLFATARLLPALSTIAAFAYLGVIVLICSRKSRLWLVSNVAFPAPTHGRSFAAVDSLRGLAALWVALFHYWQWPTIAFNRPAETFAFAQHGDKAVPLFVVVSGFLIWGSAVRIRNQADLRAYTINRFLRLVPLFVTVVLVTLALGYVIGRGALPGGSTWKTAVHESLLARSFNSKFFILPQSWSLFVELNFYMFAPLAAAVFVRSRTPILCVPATALYFSEFGGDFREFGLWKYFLFGMAARQVLEDSSAVRPLLGTIVFLLGTILLIIDLRWDWTFALGQATGIILRPTHPTLTFGLGIACAALVFGAASSDVLQRTLGSPLLRVIGIVSYSIFLWHSAMITMDLPIRFDGIGLVGPIGDMVALPSFGFQFYLLAIPALVLVGIISFLLIEKPILALRSRWSAPPQPL